MYDPRGDQQQSGDDGEYRPQWPQRPKTGPLMSARLDPPDDGGRGESNPQPSKWTSTPTSNTSAPDGNDTRVLPVVQPSRFEKGVQARSAPASPQQPQANAPQAPSPNRESARVRQPQDLPQQPPQPNQSSAQPRQQPKKAGGWQYERQEEQAYDVYQEGNQQYARVPRVSVNARWGDTQDHGRYLSMDIDGVRKKRGGWILWVLVGILAIAAIGVTAFSLAWQGQYAGKIFAGVSILGEDIGGKTPDDARELLNDKLQEFLAQPVVFTWQGKDWRPSADQIGLKVDVDGAVNEAFQVGRNSDTFSNAAQQWDAAQTGYVVPLTVQLSEPTLQSYLDTIAQNEIDQELFEGDVRLSGTQINAMPGKEGRNLRIYDTIVAVRGVVVSLEPGKTISLPVDVTQPTVSADEVNRVSQQLAIRISSPITATVPGKTLTLDQNALINFTTIERNPDRNAPKHIELGWKDNELKIVADKWATEATHPAQNAKFAWNNGSVAVLSESIDGLEVDASSVITAIKQYADTPDKRQFDLPGKVITPTVSSKDIAALGIKELMGTGTSTYVGSSPERATNIKVAAGLLNGAVVAPGATFSFLQTMGGIDESHGFVEGYVIAAERTQRGVGGGVCQVSTTTFRAAFWSATQITDRHQHSYRVSWYEANGEPVGFDAAVFDPGVDLQFVNTTGSYILIEAIATSDKLTVNFYGTKIPGEVKLEGPVITNRQPPPPDVYEVDPRLPAGTKKQVETAHAGLDTLITRRIITPGQPDKVDEFRSSYQPWPNWYIVASASQIPPGAQVAAQPTPNP